VLGRRANYSDLFYRDVAWPRSSGWRQNRAPTPRDDYLPGDPAPARGAALLTSTPARPRQAAFASRINWARDSRAISWSHKLFRPRIKAPSPARWRAERKIREPAAHSAARRTLLNGRSAANQVAARDPGRVDRRVGGNKNRPVRISSSSRPCFEPPPSPPVPRARCPRGRPIVRLTRHPRSRRLRERPALFGAGVSICQKVMPQPRRCADPARSRRTHALLTSHPLARQRPRTRRNNPSSLGAAWLMATDRRMRSHPHPRTGDAVDLANTARPVAQGDLWRRTGHARVVVVGRTVPTSERDLILRRLSIASAIAPIRQRICLAFPYVSRCRNKLTTYAAGGLPIRAAPRRPDSQRAAAG